MRQIAVGLLIILTGLLDDGELMVLVHQRRAISQWEGQEAASSGSGSDVVEQSGKVEKPSFLLEIPKIGGRWIVSKGADPATLKMGPGVFKGWPGDSSVWIAGHRSLSVFWRLPELKTGDSVIVSLSDGQQLVYLVQTTKVISPMDEKEIERITQESDLVLFTCHPPGIANKRWLIICRGS